MSEIDEDAFAKIIAKDSWLKPHDIFQWRSIIEAYEKAKGGGQPVAITGETSDGYHTFNELYEHRHALFRLACLNYDGWKSKLHDDGTMFDGWFIAGVETPDGQVTYHLPIALWDSFAVKIYVRAPKWDGHTSSDVVNRLAKLATREQESIALEEGDIEYRQNLVADLRGIHTSAFINDEVMPRRAKADMLQFIYKTCIKAANELEETIPPEVP